VTDTRPAPHGDPDPEQVDAVMAAARVLVGATARSFVAVEDTVTLPQWRVLVMVAGRGTAKLGEVAEGLGVHPSNVTRACDRLVAAGLLTRRDDPSDRRSLMLTLTTAGRAFVQRVDDHRRETIRSVLRKLPAEQRPVIASAMRAFAAAGGEFPEAAVWNLGWRT
jgi:DNA-binding MarR family transcriptional regulator